MKGKKFFNAKNIVIGLVSCVLIGASATGVAVFLKDRGEAAAAQQQGPVENLPVTGNDGINNNQAGENTNTTDENLVAPVTPGEDENDTTDETESTEGTTGDTGTTSGTTGTTSSTGETVQGITETVVERERKVFEDLELSWTTIEIPAVTADMGIYKPELQIEKTATEIIRKKETSNETEENSDEIKEELEEIAENTDETTENLEEINENIDETTENLGETNENTDEIKEDTTETIKVDPDNKPMVRPGDTIIFTIKVSNIGNYKATNVVITDSLDVIFDDKEVKAGEPIVTIETLDYGKVATLKVAYEVTQDDIDATEIVDEVEVPKNIENIAYATDGKQSVQDDDDIPVNPDVEVTVTKEWDDAENQDGKRPNSIEIQLYKTLEGETEATSKGEEYKIELTAGEDEEWQDEELTYTWEHLPKYENGKEITYTVKEVEVPKDYEVSYSEDTLTVTNIHIPEVIEKTTVTKVWDDASDQDGRRPDSIKVQLYKTLAGDKEATSMGEEYEIELTAGEDEKWDTADLTYTWENLPKYESGKEITYTVKEVEVPKDYEVSYSEDTFTITNKHTPEVIEKTTVTKIWDDANNQDGKRTSSIQVQLYKTLEGTTTAISMGDSYKVTLSAGTDKVWQDAERTYTWNNLPKYENGKKITYTVAEVSVPSGYTVSYSKDTFTITNKHTPEVIEKTTVTKVWNDANNQDGRRPSSIQVQLYKTLEGTTTAISMGDSYKVTLSAGTDKVWQDTERTYTWYNLPKYENGKKITYTVAEVSVPSGYTVSYNQATLTITNTHTPEKINISGSKTWHDNNNAYGTRPTSITVNLLANGTKVESKTVTASNNWSWTFSNYPKYKDGKEITYTITENAVTGYTTTINKYNITNTLTGVVEALTTSTITTQTTTPVDVVLVLDVSNSMDDTNSSTGNMKAADMVNAVNSMMSTIMSRNERNRVGIVTFSAKTKSNGGGVWSTAQEFVPLAHYSSSTGNYLSFDSSSKTISTSLGGNKSVTLSGGTFMQTGIVAGINMLKNATNITYTDSNGNEITHTPVLIILTDGEPTFHNSRTWDEISNPWADQYRASGGAGTKSSWDDVKYTVKTAQYYRPQINATYGTSNVYTIGFSSTKYSRATLNPTSNNSYAQYNYVDNSYINSMTAAELTEKLNSFVYSSSTLKATSNDRFLNSQEINSKTVQLGTVNTSKEFIITVAGRTICTTWAGAQSYIGGTQGSYYVNLTSLGTSQVYIKYHTN